jgi:hypothetical protein
MLPDHQECSAQKEQQREQSPEPEQPDSKGTHGGIAAAAFDQLLSKIAVKHLMSREKTLPARRIRGERQKSRSTHWNSFSIQV